MRTLFTALLLITTTISVAPQVSAGCVPEGGSFHPTTPLDNTCDGANEDYGKAVSNALVIANCALKTASGQRC